MSKPKIAAREPKPVNLVAGKRYLWCACGLSKTQPFCDQSHKGTEFLPVPFTAEEDGEAWLCMCKRSGDAPYCDGSHETLGDDD